MNGDSEEEDDDSEEEDNDSEVEDDDSEEEVENDEEMSESDCSAPFFGGRVVRSEAKHRKKEKNVMESSPP